MSDVLYDKVPAFCPSCGWQLREGICFCPNCGRQLVQIPPFEPCALEGKEVCIEFKSLTELPCFNELDDDTQTKIGSFERIYRDTYQKETGIGIVSMGVNDWDYSPLVNPLASALEIELGLSLFPLIKLYYGNSFKDEAKTITLKSGRPTLGDFISFMHDNEMKYWLKKNHLDENLRELLTSIRKTRNKASHKEVLTKKDFVDFYQKIYEVFARYGTIITGIKKRVDKKQVGQSPSPISGIIFTDVARIAQKISCIREEIAIDQIWQAIENYVQTLQKRYGINYRICNVDTRKRSWEDYHAYLMCFCRDIGLNFSSPIGLFIVGGDDVIPMPKVGNNVTNDHLKEKFLEADMLYAYGGTGNMPFVKEDGTVNPEILVDAPRFCVGRLPLPSGELSKDAYCAFLGYFNRVLKEFVPLGELREPGIRIDGNNHVAVVAESLLKLSSLILDKTPLKRMNDYYTTIRENRFVSPGLDIGALWNPLPVLGSELEVLKKYAVAIKEAEMLSFVLHGGWKNGMGCGYFGEAREEKRQMLAFHPRLFKDSQCKVVTACCCWGARYIGYKLEESALLTAIYGCTLLFMGACRTSWGTLDKCLELNLVKDIPYANKLMKLYLEYLLQGYPAGEALERSKMECILVGPEMDYTMTTVLEFNLYGDPLLKLHPQLDRDFSDNRWLQKGYRKAALQQLIERTHTDHHIIWNKLTGSKSDSLLEYIRGLVNRNLQEIHEKVNQELYTYYHVEPHTLSSILSCRDCHGAESYCFCYMDNSNIKEIIVYTDNQGNIENIIVSL